MHLATGLSFFFFLFFEKTGRGGGKRRVKKREKTWISRNGKDFQTERHGRESVGETGRRWIWHCAPLKRGTRHIQDVLILASRFVCSSRKSIWHITINMYWGILYILSQVCLALQAQINETDREKVPCEYVHSRGSSVDSISPLKCRPAVGLEKKKFNKVWSPFISSQTSVGAFHSFLCHFFFSTIAVFSASSVLRLSKESWLHRLRSGVWRRWTLSSWILSLSPSMAKWINDVPPFNRRAPMITKGFLTHFEDT